MRILAENVSILLLFIYFSVSFLTPFSTAGVSLTAHEDSEQFPDISCEYTDAKHILHYLS